jgi:methyltransferase (TIGR00027 family)
VVLVAAGLDTRAYRLDWPTDLRLFELDLPEVLAFKQRVLADRDARPTCERTALGVDLRTDWPAALRTAGFRPELPTAWLVEGLLVYLDAEQADTLIGRVAALSAPGSQLACETQAPRPAGPPDADDGPRPSLAGYTALWKGGLGDRLPDRVRELGWDVEVVDRTDTAVGYGLQAPPSRGAGFLHATRTAA